MARRDRLNGSIDPSLAVRLMADEIDGLEVDMTKWMKRVEKKMDAHIEKVEASQARTNGLLIGLLGSTSVSAIFFGISAAGG